MASDEMTLKQMAQTEKFMEAVRLGVGHLNAALEVGWSPGQFRRFMRDDAFRELVAEAEERRYEGIEETLYGMAQRGNMKAIQMVLYNKRADQWRDVRHIQVDKRESLDVGVVVAVKAAALELLVSQGAAALQPGGRLDVIDAEAHDVDE